MKKRLTTKMIEALPPAKEKRYEVSDTVVSSLRLRVSYTGGKVYYLCKRFNKRMHRRKIGSASILSLRDAREKAREIEREIELGIYKTPLEKEHQIPELGEIIPQFIELYAKPRNKDWKGTQSLLAKFSRLYSRPIDQVKPIEIFQVIDGIVASGAPVRANRALVAFKKLMNWCIDRGIIVVSPAANLKVPTKEVARDRVLTDDELAACWHAAVSEGYPFAHFMQMSILLGQRRGEIAHMQHSELDLEKGLWTLPGKRAKNAMTHIVPLAPLAVDILKSAPRFQNSDFVFTTTGTTPISGFGRLKARIDASMPPDIEDWRFHDLRRTMATNMAMLRIQPHIIEAVLNHKNGVVSGVAAVYNRHAYIDEKREALEAWADRVGSLIGKDSGGKSACTE